MPWRNRIAHSDLLERLRVFRRMVRTRLLAYGLVAVAAGGVFAFLTIVSLDWLLRLPAILRLVVAMLFLVGFAGAALHWIVRPLRAQLDLREIAGTLERHFGRTDDRLSSTVDFVYSATRGRPSPALAAAGVGSESLLARIVAGTDELVRGMAFEDALSLRPFLLRVGWLVAGLGLLATICYASPDWAQIGMNRYLLPFSRLDWPHQVEIKPWTQDVKVAFGESVTLRMAVTRGASEVLRGVVRLRDREGRLTSLTMYPVAARRHLKPEGSASRGDDPDAKSSPQGVEYACTIDGIASDLTYWFEAGDASTADVPLQIRAVRRPEILSTSISAAPPPYAAHAAPRELDVGTGDVRVVVGSTLTVAVRASKPTARLADPQGTQAAGSSTPLSNCLRFTDGTEIALQSDANDPHELTADFSVIQDGVFRIHLTDREGFSNRGGSEFRIAVQPDLPPLVTMVEPNALTEVTAAGAVNVVARIDDDFGVTRVELLGQKTSGSTGSAGAAAPTGEFLMPLPFAPAPDAGSERVSMACAYVWQVASLGAAPGDVFTFQVRAVDNCAGDACRAPLADGGQEGRSTPLRLKIISEIDLENRLRDEFALLQTRLRQALEEQELVKDDTDRLQAEMGSSAQPLSPEQREQTAGLAIRESRLTARVRELSRQFEQLRRRMALNRPGESAAGEAQETQRLAAALQSVADEALSRAVSGLEQARAAAAAPQQQQGIEAARSGQQAALDVLRELVQSVGAWGDFREVVNKARELFDRQQALRAQVTQLGKQTLGKSPQQLDPQQSGELAAQTRRQRQLADQTERLLATMQRLATSRHEHEPAASEALDAANRSAAGSELPARMREAAARLQENRTAAAINEQRTAEQALGKMLAALQESSRGKLRELAELNKRLEQAEETLTRLLSEQRALLNENQEAQRRAADTDTFLDLADRQKLLRRNTAQFADELAENPRSADAGRATRRAVPPMTRAEERLAESDQAPAGSAQQEAVKALEEALAVVQSLARQAQHESAQTTLAALRLDLEALRNQQQDLNGQTAEVVERLMVPGGAAAALQRADARKVTQFARQQGTLRDQADELRRRMGEAVVYDWIMQRVVTGMERARSALDNRRLDRALISEQADVLTSLTRLIDAIAQTEALPPSDDFAESSSGEGGEGQGPAPNKPVPTVAELIVLRTLQADINARTAQLGADFNADAASEDQLKQLQALGEEQHQVRELTETVTQKARKRGG
ncbi:MAG TPA: DUF4175 family protein [Phycisphaerae bacterium]